MLFKKETPSDPLRKYVDCYWVAKADGDKVLRVVSPSTNISLCIHLGHSANYRLLPSEFYKGQDVSLDAIIKWVNTNPTTAQNVIIGPHRRLMVETCENFFYALGVEFKTGVRKSFFGTEILRLSDKIMPLDSGNILLSRLPAIISNCAWKDIFDVVDRYLTDKLLPYIDSKGVGGNILELIEEISEHPFDANAPLMVGKMKTCLRSVEYCFKQYTGLTPKQFIGIHRINRVVECMMEHQEKNLAEVLELCGYYDQAHINRDFKIVGALPATQVFKNIRRLQVGSPGALYLNSDLDSVCGFNLLI
ncbi:MAG: AraC family transcriptional regulator [Bacteroidales bacterium]|nr:AraC family transcriptional regulator [Bacteroidales bacterium]